MVEGWSIQLFLGRLCFLGVHSNGVIGAKKDKIEALHPNLVVAKEK